MGGRTVDCPICFSAQLTLPLRPLIVDVQITVPIPPNVGIDIEFDQAMNTSVLPGNLTFRIYIDGGGLDVTVNGWTDSTHLGCTYVGALPTTSGQISQIRLDTNCYSALGTYARPQSALTWYP